MKILVFLSLAAVIPQYLSECQPKYADACFTDVLRDLNFMFNLQLGIARNLSQGALRDLCLSIDDSLQCTTDIIDEDCSGKEGRSRLDAWVKTFESAASYACRCDTTGCYGNLLGLLQAIPCWNINSFWSCFQRLSKMDHIGNLLNMELDNKECQELKSHFHVCYEVATEDSCREQEDVRKDFEGLVEAFFQESPCRSGDFHSSSNTPLQMNVFNVLIVGVGLFQLKNWYHTIL